MKLKLIGVACLCLALSASIQATSYVMSVSDLYIDLDYEQKRFYQKIPVEITPLSADIDDIFILASYGGLSEKNSQQFSLGSIIKDDLEKEHSEKVSSRVLRSRESELQYSLLARQGALSDIKLIHQVVAEDNVLPVYTKERTQALDKINKDIILKIDTNELGLPGRYTDIFTLYLYKGKYSDEDPELQSSTQLQLNIDIPSVTRSEIQVSKDSANPMRLKAAVNVLSNLPAEVSINGDQHKSLPYTGVESYVDFDINLEQYFPEDSVDILLLIKDK